MPACWASAGVGQIVPHQRRASRASLERPGAPAAARCTRPGRSRPARGVLAGAPIATHASTALDLGQLERRRSRRAGARARGGRSGSARRRRAEPDAAATRRARGAPRAAASERLLGERRGRDSTCWPGSTSRHQSQISAARSACGIDHGACSSGKCSVDVRAQRVADERPLVGGRHPVAPQQLLLPAIASPRSSTRPRAARTAARSRAATRPHGAVRRERVGVLAGARRASASRAAPARCPRRRCSRWSERWSFVALPVAAPTRSLTARRGCGAAQLCARRRR